MLRVEIFPSVVRYSLVVRASSFERWRSTRPVDSSREIYLLALDLSRRKTSHNSFALMPGAIPISRMAWTAEGAKALSARVERIKPSSRTSLREESRSPSTVASDGKAGRSAVFTSTVVVAMRNHIKAGVCDACEMLNLGRPRSSSSVAGLPGPKTTLDPSETLEVLSLNDRS